MANLAVGARSDICRRRRPLAMEAPDGPDPNGDAASLPDELPLSDEEPQPDLPDELPVDMHETQAPSAEPALFNVAEGPPGLPHAVGRRPGTRARGKGQQDLATVTLTPAPRGKGHGRGRGRRAKVGPQLCPPVAAQPPPTAGETTPDGLQTSSGSGGGAAGRRASVAGWLHGGLAVDNATERATIGHSLATLRYGVVQQGFASPLTDSESLVAALVAQLQSGRDADERVERVAHVFLSNRACALSSMEALSAALGVHRKTLGALAHRCAAGLGMLAHARWGRLEAALVNSLPRAALVHYVEAVQYDETPLWCRVVGDLTQANTATAMPATAAPSQRPAEASSSNIVCRVGQSKSLQVKASGAPQRIMQTRGEMALVLRLGGKLVSIAFKSHFPLSVLEQCTAKCIKQQQLSMSRVGRAAKAFKSYTRAVTTDAFSGNKAAEGGIAQERAKGEGHHGSLHLLCAVHATAGVYDRCFSLVDAHITGVIRAALALRSGAAMARFRACLREEIGSRLEIKTGFPSAAASNYKKQACRLFVSHGQAALTRRALLALCPNGDWRASSVQYHASSEEQQRLSPDEVKEHLTNGLVVALASSQPALYNRSKWTGSDMAVDDLGIFEAVHRLLSTTFARFCASYQSGALAASFLVLGKALAKYDCQQRELEGEAGEEREVVAEEQAVGEATPGGGEAVAKADREDAASKERGDAPDWVRENVKHRKIAMAFLRGQPLALMILIRLLMEPLRQYMGKQFRRAADKWDFSQRAAMAHAAEQGREHVRQLRVVQVAEGSDDRQFALQVRLLASTEHLWAIMPPSFHTVRNRALAFRCISRVGCAFAKLLATRHQRFPFRVFLLLLDPAKAQELLQTPDCLLDGWTKTLKGLYPDFSGEEFQQVLYTVALLLRVDISSVESRHASIRRLLTARSVQTHPMGFADLSAQWVFQQHRTQQAAEQPKKKAEAKQGDRRSENGRQQKARAVKKTTTTKRGKPRKPGFGGAWRAWVRMKASAYRKPDGVVDMAELSKAYRDAKADNTEEYQRAARVGKEATKQGRRTGRHGFGGAAATRRKAQSSVRRWALALQMRGWGADPAARALALAAYTSAAGHSVQETLAIARHAKRLEGQAAAAEEQKQAEALARFRSSEGESAIRAVKQSLPELQPFPMVANPSPQGLCLEVEGPSEGEVCRAVSWATELARTNEMASRLQGQWELLHRTLMSAHCPDVPSHPAETACFRAGVCLCSVAGKAFKRRVDKFIRQVKTVCPMGSASRTNLAEGRLVVRLLGRPRDFEAVVGQEGAIVDRWLHIGLMYFSPYEPTLWQVEPVDDQKEMAPDDKRVFVSGTENFLSLHQAMEPFRTSETISMRWYQMEETDRPLAAFLPQPVPIVQMAGFGASQQFWPRARAAGGRGERSAANDAPVAADDEAEDVEGNEEGEPALENEGTDADFEAEFSALLHPLLDAYEEPLILPAPDAPPSGEDSGGEEVRQRDFPTGHPPPPVPVAAPRADEQPPRKRQARASLHSSVAMANGVIMYYRSNGNFEARCSLHADERCTLTRRSFSMAASSSASAPRFCRPLGLLAAWLEMGAACENKASHKARATLARLAGAEQRAFRHECREALSQTPGADELLAEETASPGEGLQADPEVVQ